jgi:hypothetical protein
VGCVAWGYITDFSALTVIFSSMCDEGMEVMGRMEGGVVSISTFLGEGGREVTDRVWAGGSFVSLELGGGVL